MQQVPVLNFYFRWLIAFLVCITRYYREMVFPLSLSAYYFIGLLAVILFVAFIRCKKMNYNFDHEID